MSRPTRQESKRVVLERPTSGGWVGSTSDAVIEFAASAKGASRPLGSIVVRRVPRRRSRDRALVGGDRTAAIWVPLVDLRHQLDGDVFGVEPATGTGFRRTVESSMIITYIYTLSMNS